MSMELDNRFYIAIIGDIRNSKSLENRRAVQQRLETVLIAVNQECPDKLASRFMITLGDEFQGLLTDSSTAVWVIDRIEREMHPVQLRFGVGIGEITTDINPDMPFGADGPAYYLARDMIDALKASEKRKMEPGANIRFAFQEERQIHVAELINATFALGMAVKEKWTARQVEVMNAYIGCGTQKGAAEALGINQSNVQKALAAANYYTYRKALEAVASILAGNAAGCRQPKT